MPTNPCKICGAPVTISPSGYARGQGKFCSRQCRAKDRWKRYNENLSVTFWERVDKSAGNDACWPWTGGTRPNGYGRLQRYGKYELAHRLAYEFHYKEAPGTLFVCHACDNPICCNPSHLFLGTHQDNMADKSRKGRTLTGSKHPQAKLSDASVLNILEADQAGVPSSLLAKKFGVHYSTVRRIVAGKRWTCLKARKGE